MQTFLPYPDFHQTAQSLDMRRLGKQRVETKQILNTLLGLSPKTGWRNHPAVKMWRGHEFALCSYGIAICQEWRKRGYNDSLLPFFQDLQRTLPNTGVPSWFSNPAVFASHRGTLQVKDPVWYSQHQWTEEAKYEYVWPVA